MLDIRSHISSRCKRNPRNPRMPLSTPINISKIPFQRTRLPLSCHNPPQPLFLTPSRHPALTHTSHYGTFHKRSTCPQLAELSFSSSILAVRSPSPLHPRPPPYSWIPSRRNRSTHNARRSPHYASVHVAHSLGRALPPRTLRPDV